MLSPHHVAFVLPHKGDYFVVPILVSDLITLGVSVKPSPDTRCPGHAIIPELSTREYEKNKSRCKAVQAALVDKIGRTLVFRPTKATKVQVCCVKVIKRFRELALGV